MQERIDGTFGDISPLRELFEKFNDQNFINETKAVHFGTPEQLEAVKEEKEEKDVYHYLDDLSERVAAIEEKDKPSVIWKPTTAQIKVICKRTNSGLK